MASNNNNYNLNTVVKSLKVTPLSNNEVKLSWESENSNIVSFTIYRNGQYFATTTNKSIIDTDFLPHIIYKYQIHAYIPGIPIEDSETVFVVNSDEVLAQKSPNESNILNPVFDYLSKTVTAEGYLSEYKIEPNPGYSNRYSPYNVHFSFGGSKKVAIKAAQTGQSIYGSIFVQFCNRDEFKKAGYLIPQRDDADSNIEILRRASETNQKVKISYWDNGLPLSGKCIIKFQVK